MEVSNAIALHLFLNWRCQAEALMQTGNNQISGSGRINGP
jgi:hypothetical protein